MKNKERMRAIHKKFAVETPESISTFRFLPEIIQPEDLADPDQRAWALENDYAKVVGGGSCAHTLWLSHCPNAGCGSRYGFDHTTIWMSKRGYGEPFILTQPYVNDVPDAMVTYAKAHGLRISEDPEDGWYGHGSVPIRLSYESSGACALEVYVTELLYRELEEA